MAKADPEMAKAKAAVAASSGGMDLLLAKDPQQLSPEELRAGIEHSRRERALWQLKQQRRGSATTTSEEEDGDGGE